MRWHGSTRTTGQHTPYAGSLAPVPRYTDLALAAGAVVVVGLGAMALRPQEVPAGAPQRTVHTATPSATASAKPHAKQSGAYASASATRSGSAAADASGATATSWVVGAGDGLVVYAPRRDCDDSGPAEVTAATLRGTTSTSTVKGLVSVGGIKVHDASRAVLVGADADCKRVAFGTKDGGRSWFALTHDPAIWSLVPGLDDGVHAPSGEVGVPCEPRSVTGLDDRVARLACTDGRLLGTVTGGEDWSILGNNRDVEAVGFVSATTALALADEAGCKGVQVERSTDGGTAFKAAYCVEGEGPWGLFTDADTAVVVGADRVARSTDDGATWSVQRLQS